MSFWTVSGPNFEVMDIEGPSIVDVIADATERGAKLEDIQSVIKRPASKLCLHTDDGQLADPRGCALCQEENQHVYL